LAVLLVHVLATLARLAGPGDVRVVVAESLLLKHQLLIVIAPGRVRRAFGFAIASSLASARCSCARADWCGPRSS
jgi:hypothetical protein